MENEFNNNGVAGEVVTQSTASNKNKLAAGLLCFFLGLVGAHRFYLGYIGTGVCMLALNVLGFLTSFILIGYGLYAILAIWWVVDLIRIISNNMKDPQGRQLSK